jgi:hypothetical protein
MDVRQALEKLTGGRRNTPEHGRRYRRHLNMSTEPGEQVRTLDDDAPADASNPERPPRVVHATPQRAR